MRLRGPAEFLEDRRRRALKLLDEGLSLNEVGRRIGCAPSSVMHWRDMRRRGGARALKVRSSPGRPPSCHLLRAACCSSCFSKERWPTATRRSCGQRLASAR